MSGKTQGFAPPWPAGFVWAIPGALGGTPQPGIRQALDEDIKALKRIGTSVLITLQDEWSPPARLLHTAGIESLHLPVPDMGVPTLNDALAMVGEVERRIALGATVVCHCRAGQGRTGTLLACHFVHHGRTGAEAVRAVRERNPNWIETEGQIAFVSRFHDALSVG